MAVVERNYLSDQLESRKGWQVFIEALLYILVNVVALFGNLLVCVAVYKTPSLRNVANVFVINLAVSDILVAVVCIPVTVAVIICGEWPFPEALCDFNGFSVFALSMVSQVGVAVVAVNRYVAVVRPQSYEAIFSSKNIRFMIAGLWLLPSIATLPPLFGWGFYEFNAGKGFCLYPFYADRPYTVMVEVVFIILPVNVICAAYFNTFREIQKSRKRVGPCQEQRTLTVLQQRERKASFTMFIAFLGFSACWVPISVIDFIDTFRGGTTLPRGVYMLNGAMIFLSSAINPCIYWATNKSFRNAFKNTVIAFRRRGGVVQDGSLSTQNTSVQMSSRETASQGL